MKTTLLAKSSSGEPYTVEFATEESRLRIFCHCQAGVLHRMCKHKKAFIEGDVSMLFDANQAELLAQIRSRPEFKILHKHFQTYAKELAEVEKSIQELEKKEKELKAKLGKGLSFGFASAE